MALMINGPAGRGTVPIEFWVDVISVEDGNMHFVQKVGIYRLPQNGYTASFPIAAEPWGMDVLLRKNKDFIWVPEIGLVNVHATVLLYLSIYKTRTENRSVARGFVEEKARSEQKSYKGVLRGEYHRVNLADVLNRSFFYSPNLEAVSRQFQINKLIYTKQIWAIDIESMDGEAAAHIVLDSNFKIKKAKRTK